MKPGVNLLDTYTIRAQVVPAILAAVPALALIAAFVSLKDFGFAHALASIGLLAVFWLFGDRARRLGKQLEPTLFQKMGGMPSIVMLRHSDDTFNPVAKTAYHAFLSRTLGVQPPTAAQEAADPPAADQHYDRACAWLRDRTRDTKKFNVLFNENMTYGARRNLLGVKPYALMLNILVVIVAVVLLAYFRPLQDIHTTTTSIATVLVVAVIHAASFLRFVNEQGVMQAARTYGRQLILSCDTLSAAAKPPSARSATAKKA